MRSRLWTAFRKRLLRDAGLIVAWVGSPAETELALFHALVELAPRIAHRWPPSRPAATAPRERERRWCESRRPAGSPGRKQGECVHLPERCRFPLPGCR